MQGSFQRLDGDLSQSSDTLWSEHSADTWDGTHLTETRSDDPGVKSPPESHFSMTRSWQKVGDGFILTAVELLTSTDSRWHEMNKTERALRPRVRHKPTSRCFSLFLCRCCDLNVIWSGYAVLESCLERKADRKAAWRSWRLLSGTPSRL